MIFPGENNDTWSTFIIPHLYFEPCPSLCFHRVIIPFKVAGVVSKSITLHNVYIVQFFSPWQNEVRHILKFSCCHTIQHIFVPSSSIEGENGEKLIIPWLSNSKFVIFPKIFPCSNYRILAFYAPIPVKIHGNSIIPL